jgi:hypothetical protein
VGCAQKMTRRGGAGKGSGSKGRGGAEHGQACTLVRNALVLWLSGKHLNRPCNSGEATKATGNPESLRPVSALLKKEANCSESLHFVDLAISACLLPSSPRPIQVLP